MKKTFDEYDRLCEQYNNMPLRVNCWPTPEEIDRHTENGKYQENHIEFFIYLMETNDPPETKEEEESKKYINKILRENLELIDEEEKENENE